LIANNPHPLLHEHISPSHLTDYSRNIKTPDQRKVKLLVLADHIGNTGLRILNKFLFNILYGSKIGKRLVQTVEVIFYQPFS
jgi:hypothetical protein